MEETLYMPGCAFCERAALDAILWEGEHFYLLADHAPLIEGHLLIVPRSHYACYGAVPFALEAEFLSLKRRVAEFFSVAYRAPIFFEHGVFHQTVYHAHLHAFPFGEVSFGVHGLMGKDGRAVQSLADVRAWYAEYGHYFYLEQPATADHSAEAAIFPPDDSVYFRALMSLRDLAETQGTWIPAMMRRASAGPKVRRLTDAWRAYSQS